MSPVGRLRAALSEPGWQYALLCGLPASLFVVFVARPEFSSLDFTPVVGAATLAGFLIPGDRAAAKTVGKRVGLVASVLVVAQLAMFVAHALGLSNPAWFTAVLVPSVVAFTAFFVVILALSCACAAVVGHWLAGKSGRYRAARASG